MTTQLMTNTKLPTGKNLATSVNPEIDYQFDELEERFKKNEFKLDLVISILESHYGDKLTVEQLRIFASRLSKRIHAKIDRMANRNRTAILCWYTENWDKIYSLIDEFIPSQIHKFENTEKDNSNQITNDIDPSDINQLINYH
ncbi:hypothetical protein TVAG_162670 [Trichomonas vaginalis G3]|uniref:Uncharacterized protein n=1 Tax=Trichomonas vaginalis (strain ATCC PRA-98 / G3) TaxID=412133 RepID=A2FV15_TRIV3|nr:hypothetical protein TVAGG3_0698690 [Trichomonas vaginalis G3]EAX91245.1 hypothetical protein TVAG_162670 [Trichomonas vaginalis G3]KAI5509094.1 hypothetical protein TVAGG3_0698690 [Trichomonas vaginalis G3]|eukprot:XP_001304175.1 hypothetical protein [Trichomonas vaginalis G3]